MSASREKKQRQGAGPSDKAIQAKKEDTAYQRKTRLYTIIGVVVVVLVIALLVWNSNPLRGRADAATVGDDTLSVAELSYYYYDARYVYAAYGLVNSSIPDDLQMYDEEKNMSFRDFFLESALSNAKQVFSLYDAAIAAGRTVNDVKDEVDADIKNMKAAAANNNYSYKAFLKAIYGRYMTPALYEKLVSKSILANVYSNDVHAEKLNAYTEAELEAHYAANPDQFDEFVYSHLLFKADAMPETDDEGNKLPEEELERLKEKAMEAAKAKAEKALEAYEKDGDVAKLIESTKPSESADHTASVGSDSLNTAYVEEFLKLDEGEALIAEYEGVGYYVAIFHSRARREQLTANVRHILISAATTMDDSGKPTAVPSEEAWATAKAEAEKVLDEYNAGEQSAEAFGALATKYTHDTASKATGGLYEHIYEGRFVKEFNDWIFAEDAPQPGDTALIRHEGALTDGNPYWGYHVAYLESWDEAEWALTVRNALASDAMTEWSESLLESGYETALAKGAEELGR